MTIKERVRWFIEQGLPPEAARKHFETWSYPREYLVGYARQLGKAWDGRRWVPYEKGQSHVAPGAPLTPREKEVLALLNTGYSVPQVARQIGITGQRVREIRIRLMAKDAL